MGIYIEGLKIPEPIKDCTHRNFVDIRIFDDNTATIRTDESPFFKVYNVKSVPSAQQDRTGEWVPSTKYKGFLTCSECEDCYIESWSNRERKWKYCPQCGVRMIGGEYEGRRGE